MSATTGSAGHPSGRVTRRAGSDVADPVVSETVARLWPGRPGRRAYRVLPSAARPRLLVPERPRLAGAAGLRAVRESGSRRSRVRTAAATAAFQVAPASWLPGQRVRVADQGIDTVLTATLGSPVVATVHLGPDRANRKPVLALTSPRGRVLGFAKVAVDLLTAGLVTAEGEALRSLQAVAHPAFTAPQALDRGQWQGLPYVVQSPLPVQTERQDADPARILAAQVELTRTLGTTSGLIADSSYLVDLRHRLSECENAGHIVTDLVQRAVDARPQTLELGAWHGDWRPTNCAVTSDTVLVWDWERFATGVPCGFDALHYLLTSRARATPDVADLAPMLYTSAPGLLQAFGVDRAGAELVTTLYLAELSARYLTDRQDETSARLGDVMAWAVPELARHTDQNSA